MHKCIFIWWQLSTTTLKISAIFKDPTPSIQLTSTWTSCSIAQVLLISLTRSLKSSLASEYSRQSILLSIAFYMLSLSGKLCIMKAMNEKNFAHAFKISENDKCFKTFILWIIIFVNHYFENHNLANNLSSIYLNCAQSIKFFIQSQDGFSLFVRRLYSELESNLTALVL